MGHETKVSGLNPGAGASFYGPCGRWTGEAGSSAVVGASSRCWMILCQLTFINLFHVFDIFEGRNVNILSCLSNFIFTL